MDLVDLTEKVETAEDHEEMIRILEAAGRTWRKENPEMDYRWAIEYIHDASHPRISEEIDKAARSGQLSRYYAPPQA